MQSPLKILFVDDHTGLRDGMIFMLQSKNPDFKITGVGTAQEAIQKLTEDNEIRVVILDMNLDGESSLNSISQMKAANPNASILVYTMYNDELRVQNALLQGIQGFVTKEAPIEELKEAIIAVSNGNTYCHSRFPDKTFSRELAICRHLRKRGNKSLEFSFIAQFWQAHHTYR